MRILLLVSLFSFKAISGSLTESFDTNVRKASSTLIWNTGLARLHATMTITNWKPVPLAQRSTSADFGDGSNGAFNSNTMSNFDSDLSTPTVIDINTDTYTNLQFTSFELPNGYTLRGVGTQPLVIRSQSDVRILGTAAIDCSGDNGEDIKSPETDVSAGGTGRCGGGNGGDGGRHDGVGFVTSERGFPQAGATNPVGGAGGADGTYGGGGGGSLFNAAAPGMGYDPTVGAGATVGGTAGTNYDNQDFSSMIGSAGGGGGGAYRVGGVDDSTGAGGGAGGGVILIYAQQDFYCEGTVTAKGGNGGGVTGTLLGGLGGGGGGGTVVILAGRDYINHGQVYVTGGTGGARGGNNAGRGGNGGPGRAWYTDSDGVLDGTGSEDTSCILQQCGTMEYDIGTLNAETISYDLLNTRPTINSISVDSSLSGASAVTVSVAGSKDNFASDDTGWLSISDLSTLSKKRYVKFRVELNNQVATSQNYINSITINYSESDQEEFIFGAGCGSIKSGNHFSTTNFLLQLLFILLPFLLIKISHQLRPKFNLGSKPCS